MENKKEMTAPNVSVGADTEQPIQKCTDHSISDYNENIKSFEEMQREMLRQLSPSYLKTVSMAALYDTVFDIQTPLIDGLLQRGTYLFVGSPKVGKSFMMAQLAYHISTGTPLWDYKVRKTTVSISHLKMITLACRNGCFRCSVRKKQAIYILQRRVKRSMAVWKNKSEDLCRNTPIQV